MHNILKSKKHILNKESYEEAKLYINENNITDEYKKIKIYSEIKTKNLNNKYLEKMKISKPSDIENYKLFETYNNITI
jgi:hypothetical protein